MGLANTLGPLVSVFPDFTILMSWAVMCYTTHASTTAIWVGGDLGARHIPLCDSPWPKLPPCKTAIVTQVPFSQTIGKDVTVMISL